MKIIYDNQIFFNQNFGGPSRYFVELVKELNKTNFNSLIVSPFHQNIYLKTVSSEYKKVITTRFKKNFLINKLNDILSNRLFKSTKHDLYHLTYFDKCYQSDKPKIITVYDLIHEKFNKDFDLNDFPKKKIFKDINHFLCISENTKKDLIEYYNIQEEKISVTHLASFIDQNQNVTFKMEHPFFLFVGSRKRYKNFKLLIKSFSKLPEIMKNFEIICFGGGEFLKEEIDHIREMNVDPNKVRNIQGSDEILVSLYKQSVALIYTSNYEGFGLPILEAMSCGCPVISSDSSCLPEVYGDAALSFENNSVENLSHCINKISTDISLRKLIIKKGFQRSKKFSWKKCADKTASVYKTLI
tara:strand:- start:753 stop:1820 length:1068 start_codon:yes stop_codon:yes gene_type:complete